MCSNILLSQIHCRLDEIFPNQDFSFGNIDMLLLGDLSQVTIFNNILKASSSSLHAASTS